MYELLNTSWDLTWFIRDSHTMTNWRSFPSMNSWELPFPICYCNVTQRKALGINSSVNFQVSAERWMITIGLLTQRTFVWFFPCMNYWVLFQICWYSKGLFTQWTTEWFLPCMNSWVLPEIWCLTKGLHT